MGRLTFTFLHMLSTRLQYADDTQIFVSFEPTDTLQCLSVIEQTTHAVRNWFTMNGLLLNPDQTEAMFLGTSRNLSRMKDQTFINISGSDIKPSEHIKSLGGNYRCQDILRSTCQ